MDNWRWPQYMLIATWIIGLLLDAHLHGRPKSGKYNFWMGCVGLAISFCIMYNGGFFK